jgi:pimeloyl-ACP methyl ester carboxylesterase
MRKHVKSSGGLWFAIDTPEVKHELNTTLIACIGGSGEVGSYSAADMPAEIDRVVNRNGFAQDYASGQPLPFVVISPLATKGIDIADHRLIGAELSNVVKLYKQDYAFLAGLSQGAQSVAGFLFQSRNGTEITKSMESSYRNPRIFDGMIMMCGKIPSSPDIDANPDMPILIIHATGDTAVPISNGINIMNKANASLLRTKKVYPSHVQRYINGIKTWQPVEIPAEAVNRMIVIIGGSHSTSWTMGYDWFAKSGPGFEFRQFVERIAKPVYKPIECTAILDEMNLNAVFTRSDGTAVKYLLQKPD